MKVSARLPTSGRNGGTTVAPSAWYQTGWPLGSVDRMRIAESAHSAHHTEVVIKGPVLLHQHDDVLDILERCAWPGSPGWPARERCCQTASSPRRCPPRAGEIYAD